MASLDSPGEEKKYLGGGTVDTPPPALPGNSPPSSVHQQLATHCTASPLDKMSSGFQTDSPKPLCLNPPWPARKRGSAGPGGFKHPRFSKGQTGAQSDHAEFRALGKTLLLLRELMAREQGKQNKQKTTPKLKTNP